jgi:hypothetical protein
MLKRLKAAWLVLTSKHYVLLMGKTNEDIKQVVDALTDAAKTEELKKSVRKPAKKK